MNRTLLDIDDTLLMKNLILPENVPVDDNILRRHDLKPFFIVQPTPGICLKAKTKEGEKIFLNICTSDKIPPPEDISDAQLFQELSDENPSFVIPISIGRERLEVDKGGSHCVTYDVAINTTYFDNCQQKRHFLLFTLSVVIDAVSNTFNKTLEDYVILKNKKAMGKLQQHRIENREPRSQPKAQKPLIEEIKSSIKDVYGTKSEISQVENVSSKSIVNSKLTYVLLKEPSEGIPIRLIGLFQMPKGVTRKDVEVLLDEDRIVVTVDKDDLTYDLSVPYILNVAQVKCLLDKDLRVLRLNMPVERVSDSTDA